MANELHPEAMIAVNAAQDQGPARTGEKNIKSPARGAGFRERDAIYIGAMRAQTFGALIPGPAFFAGSYLAFTLVKKKFQQRHPDRHAVGRLFEVDSSAIFIDLRGKLIHAGQRMHDDRILEPLLPKKPGTDGRITAAGSPFLHALLLLAGHVKRVIAQPRDY